MNYFHIMFLPSHSAPARPSDADLLLIHRGPDLLVTGATAPFPDCLPLRSSTGAVDAVEVYLGTFGGRHCYAQSVGDDMPLPGAMETQPVRSFLISGDPGVTRAVSLSRHLLHWHRTTQFCGRCGATNALKSDERAKECPSCNLVVYPRISPAIITAITRGDEILLARNRHYRLKTFSLIAGFVEPGETLEDAVRRETLEEVGLTVDTVTYFTSQPWPFPDSLMVGFTAQWCHGDITVDANEIDEAAWFKRGSLPDIPPPGSISRTLIDWFENS